MIHIIRDVDMGEYNSPDAVNYSLSRACRLGQLLDDIAPPEQIEEYWQKSDKGDKAWKMVSSILWKQIEESVSLRLLVQLSCTGKNVNVMCTCKDYRKCVRGLLAEQLAKANVEMFVR